MSMYSSHHAAKSWMLRPLAVMRKGEGANVSHCFARLSNTRAGSGKSFNNFPQVFCPLLKAVGVTNSKAYCFCILVCALSSAKEEYAAQGFAFPWGSGEPINRLISKQASPKRISSVRGFVIK